MNPELIGAIAGLWKLALVVLLIVCFWRYPEAIRNAWRRLTDLSVKRGDTEVSMSKEADEVEQRAGTEGQTAEDSAVEGSKDEKEELSQAGDKAPSEPIDEMVRAYLNRDIGRGKEAYERAQSVENDTTQKLMNEALHLHLQFKCGDTSALENLQTLGQHVEQEGSNPELLSKIHNLIGLTYEEADDSLRAATAYETAASAAQTDESHASLIVSLSHCLFALGNKEEAYDRICQQISAHENPKALAALYSGLASLYQKDKNTELRAIALEKAIESSPNDTGLLFDAAYAYSEEDLRSLSLLHYAALLQFKPDHRMALNNIGVTYGELRMPVHKVKSLRKSVKEGETLAAANLAYQYLQAGFAEEAAQVLDKAKRQVRPHQNVGSALADLNQRQEAELKERQDYLERARKQRQFLVAFGEAYFTKNASEIDLGGDWCVNVSKVVGSVFPLLRGHPSRGSA